MQNEHPTQLMDLRYRVDHITPKKNQLFEEFITSQC